MSESNNLWLTRDPEGKYDNLMHYLPIDEAQQAERELLESGAQSARNGADSLFSLFAGVESHIYPSPEDLLISAEEAGEKIETEIGVRETRLEQEDEFYEEVEEEEEEGEDFSY